MNVLLAYQTQPLPQTNYYVWETTCSLWVGTPFAEDNLFKILRVR